MTGPPYFWEKWGTAEWALAVAIIVAVLALIFGRRGLVDFLRWRAERRQRPASRITPPEPSQPTIVAFRSVLPTPEPHFTGREQELDDTVAALTQDRPVLIRGIPGIGKSTLATQAVHDEQIRRHFSGGILWFDEVGAASCEGICDAVARAMKWEHIPTLPGPAEKELALRASLAGQRLLIVLDNADNPAALRHFCSHVWPRTLATSRKDVADLETIPLEPLPHDKAVELLEKEAGRPYTGADKETLGQVARLLEGHPLALAIAGRQLRGQTAAALLESLRAVPLGTLVDPADPTRAVRLSFESSYRQLLPDAQTRFATLGVFAADFDLAAAQAVVPGTQGHHLADLVGRSLVGFDPNTARYRLHALLRHYAQEKLDQDSQPYRRMAEHYLSYAQAHRAPTPENYGALERELPNLLGAMDEAEARLKEGWLVVAFADALCMPVDGVLSVRGYWGELVARGRRALAAAEALKDEGAAARLGGNLATALEQRGEYAEAERLYQQAKDYYEKAPDEANVAVGLHQLGVLAQLQGDYPQAEGLYRQSLEIKERLGNPAGIAYSLGQLGNLALAQGKLNEARQCYEQTLEISRKLGDQSSVAKTFHQLGVLAQAQGYYPQAEGLYRQSLEIEERLGNQGDIAATLHQLGRLAEERGDYPQAEGLYRQSLEIAERLGNQAGIAISLHQLGVLAELQGDYPQAEGLYRQSLEIKQRLGDQAGIASTTSQLGILAMQQGHPDEAERLHQESLAIRQKIGDQQGIAIDLHQLGILAQLRGDYPQAEALYRQSLEIEERLGSQAGIASSLGQLGLLAEAQGQTEKAADYLRQALDIFERLGSPDAAIARRSLERVSG